MRPMEHGTDAIECDSHARSAAFGYFGSVVQEHRFNVRPSDVGASFEDGGQHALVFAHENMISINDINWEGMVSALSRPPARTFSPGLAAYRRGRRQHISALCGKDSLCRTLEIGRASCRGRVEISV